MVLSTSSSEAPIGTDTISRRGFMISRTYRSSRSSTRWIMSSCSLGRLPGETAGTDDELQFFGGMAAAAVAAPAAQQVCQTARGAFDHRDENGRRAVEEHEHRRHDDREAIGLIDGQILRHDFADHHVAVGHQRRTRRRNKLHGGWPLWPGSARDGKVRAAFHRACPRRPNPGRGWRASRRSGLPTTASRVGPARQGPSLRPRFLHPQDAAGANRAPKAAPLQRPRKTH